MDEKGQSSSKDSHNEITQKGNEDKQTNAEEEENNKKEEDNNFSFLEKCDKEPDIFEFKIKDKNDLNEENNIFHSDSIKYAIGVLLKGDSSDSSNLLKYTIDGIFDNFDSLNNFGISPKNIIIYIFVNKINEDKLVSVETINEQLKDENKDNYLLTHFKKKGDKREYEIKVICKRNYMSDIESLKLFYCNIVSNLKTENNIIITSIITAGVHPNKTALSNLIQSCLIQNPQNNERKERDCVSVPALEIDPNLIEPNLFGKIIKYERVHFNIYNMNYYKSTGAIPILSLLNTMSFDKSLLNKLMSFYADINIVDKSQQMKIDYHDYNLGLFLYQSKIRINYVNEANNESLGTILYKDYKDYDYKDIWISRYSGYYSNFFNILKSLKTGELPILDKIFTVFQIIGMAIEYIYPSLSTLIIYPIFVEAFDEMNTSSAWFMTMLYVIMYIGSGITSLIGEKTKETLRTNNIYYYFMEIYYLFILVCSIVAMDNIKKRKLWGEKYFETYKFNEAACACLIVFTFILSIIPMILRKNMILKHIVPMLVYFIFGAPASTSSLLIAKIWRATDSSGGENIEDRKGINILFFFLFNLFFGFLTAYNYDREKRANCVMGLAIFYLIYLFFKIMGIVLSIMQAPDLSKDKSEKIELILSGKEIFESKRSDDNANVEKLDDSGNENNNKEENKDNEEINQEEIENNEQENNDE